MKPQDHQFLVDLLQTPSPTGFEMPGQRVWANFVKEFADETTCDSYGSTWAILKGKSAKTIMLEAHADEIGYMIKHIDDNGFLRLDRVGGSDAATARGRRLRIMGDRGDVTGVIGNTAIHLRRDDLGSEKAPQVHELWVDVGCSNAKQVAELGLRVGHVAVYYDGTFDLAHNRIVGRALDNRIGGYIIAQVMKKIASSKKKPDFSLLCLNAVQEEIGGNGAMMATYRLMPDACICLDVTHATDTPGIDPCKFGKVTLGGGPTVSHGSANHPLLVKKIMQVADDANITLQHEASSRFTGTDTDKIFHTRDGVPSALISLPLRSMHSVVETAHLDDVNAIIDLLCSLVLQLKTKETFHQSL